MRRLPHAQARRVPMISCVLVQLGSPLLASSLYSFGLYCGYLMCGGAWLLIVSYVSAAMCSGACSLSSLTAFDCGTVCWSAALMGIRWRFQVDTLEVSGSFGSGPLSVIPFCHRIPITHGATSTTPSTREVAYERQEIDNATAPSNVCTLQSTHLSNPGGVITRDQAVKDRENRRFATALCPF